MKRLTYGLLVWILLSSPQKALSQDNDTIGPSSGGHKCEWSPHKEAKPDGLNCGFNDLSVPKTGVYECGKGDDCQDTCVFESCGD